jgi:5-methylcytosine-specific restriction enzyme A
MARAADRTGQGADRGRCLDCTDRSPVGPSRCVSTGRKGLLRLAACSSSARSTGAATCTASLEQGGIVTPASMPIALLITGEAGLGYGYNDKELPDGTFVYHGEGQIGSMSFVRGNRAIRDHAQEGRDLHLFEKVPPAHLRYRGQYVCAGYDEVPDVPDAEGSPRTAIAFRLVPLEQDDADMQLADGDVARLSLAELREAALASPDPEGSATEAKRHAYRRSAAVREYVLRRADGICEGCSAPAPFKTKSGRPYLEPHHTRRISDGGPDHPAAVIGLCPSCHRRAHYADDGETFNNGLIAWLRAHEGPT